MISEFHPETVTAAQITGRRIRMITFVVLVSGTGSLLMADLLWGMPFTGWGVLSWLLFTLLFTLITFGFAQALFGFLVRRNPQHRQTIAQTLPEDEEKVALAPTAIVMPIYNEDVQRVYAGLKATYRSLERTGQIEQFDFVILSDSTDPNIWVEEEMGWVDLSRELGARGRLFYRRRRVHTNKKAGNIADFCRRWGRRYRYMVVLDADSVMSGETVVKLVRLMECNPRAGLIQTAPQVVRGESLMARVMQIAARIYGPIFREGMNHWQQGEGNYWGHNAIIRVAPFVEHCALPTLPGREPFGGRILSHDFVEAALLRRAGWSVWLWPDAPGSYEEGPPDIIEYAKRDRRWCQGNLQHFWLLFARRLHGVSRIHLFLGIFSYASSLFWLLSLVLGSLLVIGFNRTGLSWLPEPGLGGRLGIGTGVQAGLLVGMTLVLLFGSKVLAIWDQLKEPGGAAAFGGLKKLVIGVGLESLFSLLVAPIFMLFHARFVVATILAQGVGWGTQRRGGDDDEIPAWSEAARVMLGHTLTGVLWLGVLIIWAPFLLWWMLPILIGLVLSIPFVVMTGRGKWGRWALAKGWLAIPEELNPPPELRELETTAQGHPTERTRVGIRSGEDAGLIRVLFDPYVNGVHRCLLRERPGRSALITRYFGKMQERLLVDGPEALTQREKTALLSDAASVDRLHLQVWLRPAEDLAFIWTQLREAYASKENPRVA